MDQLRTALTWLKQHHFWVLTVLVALIGLGSWYSAAGKLSQQYQQNQSKITAEFNSLSSLRSNAFHANQAINARQAEEIARLAKSVGVIWQKLYDRQREGVLVWPAALNQEFRDYVEKLEFGAEIPTHLRQNYQDYVERYFPTLPKMIGARVMSEGERSSFGGGDFMSRRSYGGEGGHVGMPTGEAGEDEGDYIVEWLDQAHVREELDFPQTPTALRIWWTQENLWVYETLLRVIRNTNEAAGATRMSNAAVRTLYSLEVGQAAGQGSRTKDRIYKLPTAGGQAAMGGDMMGMEMGGMEGGFGEGGPMGGPMGRPDAGFRPESMSQGGPMSSAEEQTFLLSYRYLDENGQPIPAGGGGSDMMGMEFGGEPAAPAQAVDPAMFGKEYKRLPVRMVLRMDQRWLPKLISECASQPLQVEVQEVRINPSDAVGGGGGGFRGGFGGGGTGGSLFPDRSGLLTFPQHPHMVDVVIQGIIYIFNRPDPNVLQPTEEPALADASSW